MYETNFGMRIAKPKITISFNRNCHIAVIVRNETIQEDSTTIFQNRELCILCKRDSFL